MTQSNKTSHHCNEEQQHHQNHQHCPYSRPVFIINPNASYTIMNIPHCSTPNLMHAFEANAEPLPILSNIYNAYMPNCSNTLGSFVERINVHADTIRLVPDDNSPGFQKLSFNFDALERGSFTIFYVAKEEANCTVKPVGSVIQEPKRFLFQKGWAQKFDQPEGGINLSLFKSNEIFKCEGDVYPLVISAEICLPSSCSVPSVMGTYGQITQAVPEKNTEGHFQVKVMNQKSWCHKMSTNNYEPRHDTADTDVPSKKRKKSKPAGNEACNAGFRTKRINSNLKGANFIFNNLGPTKIIKYMNKGPGAGGRNVGKKAGSINGSRGYVSFTS